MIQRLEDLSDKVEAVVAYLKGLCVSTRYIRSILFLL